MLDPRSPAQLARIRETHAEKLTDQQSLDIRELYHKGWKAKELAAFYHVSEGTIRKTALGFRRQDLPMPEFSVRAPSKGTTVVRRKIEIDWNKPRRDLRLARITAFGETKSLAQWARDPRCQVNYRALQFRIKYGISPETAITYPLIPIEQSAKGILGGRRKPTKHARYVEAFGERKPIADWVRDPRCVVNWDRLWERITRGIAPEAAITTPVVPNKGNNAARKLARQ